MKKMRKQLYYIRREKLSVKNKSDRIDAIEGKQNHIEHADSEAQ